jgi:hypothetical protein
VGNPDYRHVQFCFQALHQFYNLSLNRHIQGGGGLVGNQKFGVTGQAHGNHYPLPHTARKLVGIVTNPLSRSGDAHLLQELDGSTFGIGFAQLQVDANGLCELLFYGQHRVQGGHRVLKDHGDAIAANFAHLWQAQLQQVLPFKQHLPVGDFPRRLGN